MKHSKTPEDIPGNATGETAGVNAAFSENVDTVSSGHSNTQTGVSLNLYGMNLRIDETAGKLIITNSILKNAQLLDFIEIQKNDD